jgi:hypothetical protein
MTASSGEMREAMQERLDQARYARPESNPEMTSPQSLSGFMDDEEISLQDILAAGRKRAAAKKLAKRPDRTIRRRLPRGSGLYETY